LTWDGLGQGTLTQAAWQQMSLVPHFCRQLACGLSEAVVEDAADESEDVAELAADTRTASPKVVKATRKRIVAILQ